MAQTTSPKVIIVGCGIAGPVIALLLQKKGYTPIILEKVRQLGDAGASLMMQPNGLKVLSLVGLAESVTNAAPHVKETSNITHTGESIGSCDLLGGAKERYGQPACGVKRTEFNLHLKQAVLDAGIELHEGWKLVDIEDSEYGVTAISEDGQKVEGSFLIGCDGIRAMSRSILLKRKGIEEPEASYTGLIQTACMSPTPASLKNHPIILNIFGPSAHMVLYPVSPDTTSWAISRRSSIEKKETWRKASPSELAAQKAQLLEEFKEWNNTPALDLISGAERLITYGLFDRPSLEPENWFNGRCILIGDAAHPTSPHLGQGANQAMEDCYHLQRLLPSVTERDSPISTSELTTIFSEFAQLRQPRTAALVAGARAQGEDRVVEAGPKTEERNERMRQKHSDTGTWIKIYDALLKEPFEM
ncbi:Salicylate hydroxylase protein [Rutstroemia sp. NJR-2017a WRK4]|nr:Salicylate hydroxylase protein [Rutstroemia sp. NJR-2017a WRK4]